jgi:hypothetical protein
VAFYPFLIGTPALAQAGVSFSNQVVTTQAPASTGCVRPTAATSFLTTNNTAYLYFEATISTGDSLTSNWLAPDGTVIPGSNWNPNSGNFCFPGASLSIGNLPTSQLGAWQARVYDNGNLLFSLPFTVTGFSNQVVTTQAPASTGCVRPTAATSFSTTDNTAYLYFEATISTGDSLTSNWLAPDSTVIPGSNWNSNSGNFCFPGASLSIGNLPASQLGAWQARVYDNGQLFFSVPFTVAVAPGGGGGATPVPSTIASPTPGSTLTGSTVTFQWTAGAGNTDYFLYLGTSPGGNDIYGQDQGTSLSVAVTGIPTNGQTVYVRVWSNESTGWLDNDYTYTAASLGNSTQGPSLTITASGSGSGAVGSSPAGTSCGSGCLSFAAGTAVTLTATPNAGSTFAGWSGACSGTGSCAVTMNSNQAVTAAFTLTVSGSTVIYSDFGPNQSFNTTPSGGWCVNGSATLNCGPAVARLIAVPVTPTANFTLATVQVALTYNSGTNGAVVQLVNSVNGAPGSTVLETWTVSNLAQSPGVITLNSTGGVILQALTQYWLVAAGSAPDTVDWWWENNLNLSGGMQSIGGAAWTAMGSGETLPAFAMTGVQSASSNPATIYQTGFEPPTFSPGTINGQDSWSAFVAPASPVIETAIVKTGLQAVGITPVPSTTGVLGAGRSAAYNAASQILTFSIDANLSATGTPSFWTVLNTSYNSSSPNIGINIDQSGQIHIFIMGTDNPTGVSIARGAWNRYELDVNFASDTVSAFYNSAPVLQGAAFSSNGTTLAGYQFYAQGASPLVGTDSGYFDNLSVTASAAPTATLMSIAVTPAGSTIALGATLQFTAAGTYSDGSTQNLTSAVSWSSSNTAVATVNASGLVTGVSAGSSTIGAASGSVTGTTGLTVGSSTLGPTASLTIATSGTGNGTVGSSPAGTSCGSGCLSFASGTAVTLTEMPNTGSTFAGWSGACSGTGSCTLTMNSNRAVTAAFSLAGIPASPTIQIAPQWPTVSAGGRVQFTAVATDAAGSVISPQPFFVWSSSAPAVATIDGNGLAQAVSSGLTAIQVSTLGIVSNPVTLTVISNPQNLTLQTAVIGSAGGSLTLPDGSQIRIDPGVLPDNTPVSAAIAPTPTSASLDPGSTINSQTLLVQIPSAAVTGSPNYDNAVLPGITFQIQRSGTVAQTSAVIEKQNAERGASTTNAVSLIRLLVDSGGSEAELFTPDSPAGQTTSKELATAINPSVLGLQNGNLTVYQATSVVETASSSIPVQLVDGFTGTPVSDTDLTNLPPNQSVIIEVPGWQLLPNADELAYKATFGALNASLNGSGAKVLTLQYPQDLGNDAIASQLLTYINTIPASNRIDLVMHSRGGQIGFQAILDGFGPTLSNPSFSDRINSISCLACALEGTRPYVQLVTEMTLPPGLTNPQAEGTMDTVGSNGWLDTFIFNMLNLDVVNPLFFQNVHLFYTGSLDVLIPSASSSAGNLLQGLRIPQANKLFDNVGHVTIHDDPTIINQIDNIVICCTVTPPPTGSETWVGSMIGTAYFEVTDAGDGGADGDPNSGSWQFSYHLNLTCPSSVVSALSSDGVNCKAIVSGGETVASQYNYGAYYTLLPSSASNLLLDVGISPASDATWGLVGFSQPSPAVVNCTQELFGDPPVCAGTLGSLVPTSVSATAIRGTVGTSGSGITGTFTLTKQIE